MSCGMQSLTKGKKNEITWGDKGFETLFFVLLRTKPPCRWYQNIMNTADSVLTVLLLTRYKEGSGAETLLQAMDKCLVQRENRF